MYQRSLHMELAIHKRGEQRQTREVHRDVIWSASFESLWAVMQMIHARKKQSDRAKERESTQPVHSHLVRATRHQIVARGNVRGGETNGDWNEKREAPAGALSEQCAQPHARQRCKPGSHG